MARRWGQSMAEDGNYQVEPEKPWHKTRLSAEEWFLRNPPHVWRTLDDAVGHYMASGFVLESRTPRIEAEMTGRGYANLRARSRYSSQIDDLIPSLRYLLRTVLPWTVFTLGVALVVLLPRYVHMVMGGEQYPSITIQANPDGSGTYVEERRKGDSLMGKPMVHPETGETGWSGLPDEYTSGTSSVRCGSRAASREGGEDALQRPGREACEGARDVARRKIGEIVHVRDASGEGLAHHIRAYIERRDVGYNSLRR